MQENYKLPLISVIIVTRNRYAELCECLDSVYKQSYPNREVIVIDSSDGETKEISTYYRNVRHYRIEHKGVAYARNQGILQAKSDYIAFIDDDCIAESDWLRRLYESLINQNADIVGGDSYFPDGKTIQSSSFFISPIRNV